MNHSLLPALADGFRRSEALPIMTTAMTASSLLSMLALWEIRPIDGVTNGTLRAIGPRVKARRCSPATDAGSRGVRRSQLAGDGQQLDDQRHGHRAQVAGSRIRLPSRVGHAARHRTMPPARHHDARRRSACRTCHGTSCATSPRRPCWARARTCSSSRASSGTRASRPRPLLRARPAAMLRKSADRMDDLMREASRT